MFPQQALVACVCVGNKDRSPLMKAILNTVIHQVRFESFGVGEHILTADFRQASPESRLLASEIGYNLDVHERKHMSQVDLKSFSAFIVVNKEVAEILVTHGVSTDAIYVMCEPDGLADPHEKPIEEFRACAAAIQREIPKIFAFLRRVID